MPANTPPASDPLLERIAQNLLATITGIAAQQASVGGFYFSDYTADRPHPALNPDFIDGRVLVVQGMTEEQDELANTCSLGVHTYFALRLDTTVAQRGTEVIDRKLNLRAADVLKAVLADPQRGGLAINTDLAYADAPDGLNDFTKARVDIVFLVQHQQSRNDPTAF